jgi:hypothetical protein
MSSVAINHASDEEHLLNDTWTMYFHEPSDSDWTMASYIRLDQISSIEDFWKVHEGMQKYISKGMFFLMREHVFPCWDDSSNIDGGCISIKVLKEDIGAFWQEIVAKLVGESLMVEDASSDAWSHVNGISTSPKRFFCICKIWLKDSAYTDKKHFALPLRYYGELMYKSNAENIRTSQSSSVLPAKTPTHRGESRGMNFPARSNFLAPMSTVVHHSANQASSSANASAYYRPQRRTVGSSN